MVELEPLTLGPVGPAVPVNGLTALPLQSRLNIPNRDEAGFRLSRPLWNKEPCLDKQVAALEEEENSFFRNAKI